MSPTKTYWKTIPLKSFIGFLLGVFFIFSPIGLINDILNLGSQPAVRLVISALLAGLFAAFYAGTGFVLRKRFWIAFVPAREMLRFAQRDSPRPVFHFLR